MDWQSQLHRAHKEWGFEYVRFHGLLSDDMHVCYRDENGAIRYSWQYIDSLFDALLDMGVRPFVEFGLFNFNGIPKPGFHAYSMMYPLGDTLLHQSTDCVVTRRGSSLRAMVWNYSENETKAVPMCAFPDHDAAARVLAKGTPAVLELDLWGLHPGETVVAEWVDEAHGNAALWRQMGVPGNLTPAQTEALHKAARATSRQVFHAPGFRWIPGQWSCCNPFESQEVMYPCILCLTRGILAPRRTA